MLGNILKNRMSQYLLVVLLVGIALVPIVNSFFYSGNNQPITVANNDGNGTYSVNLLAYGDTVDYNCSDSDNGIKPLQSGIVSWLDPQADANGGTAFYSFRDFCSANGKLIELGCVKDFNIDGNQYHDFVAAVTVDCNAIGYNSCNPLARRCV
jgi:hypothetical protein